MSTRRLAPAACLALALAIPLGAPAASDGDTRPLGRLFHTPTERALLDARPGAGVPPVAGRRPAPAARPPAPERARSLRGFVLRSDGQDSYWLDRSATAGTRDSLRQ